MLQDDYRIAREHAVFFDVSDRGLVQLTGPDARKFLHNLCTNDILNLPIGGGCEAFLATAKAKTVAYLFVRRLAFPNGTESLGLDTGPGMAEKVVKHLDRYLISEQVEIADHTADFAHFYVVGPAAPAASIVGSRRDLGTFPAFDVFCPRDHSETVRQFLSEKGVRAAGPEILEILRIEAGIPVFGKDIDEERFVVEVGRGTRAICYTKGCYLGQEPIVMARDRGHVNRTLLGLKIAGEGPATPGDKVIHDGQEVGQVTSSVVSPRLGPIALAYLRRGCQEPGTELRVGERTAVVAALPFEG